MTPILLLHGALGTKDQLNGLKEHLESSFDVHSINFEGHGNRQSDNAFSIDLFVQNVMDFLEQEQIEKTNILGYSMGGYVALNLALNKPEIVDKIMTFGTKFDWTPESAEREVKMLNPEKIEEKVPTFAQKLDSLHSENDWKKVVKKTAQMMLKLGQGDKLSADDLAKIQHDVLISIGTKDHMVSIQESEMAANTIPNGRLLKLDNEPHMIEQVEIQKICDEASLFFKKSRTQGTR